MSATNPESNTTSYTYDLAGNVMTRTDPNNTIMMITGYDALNRPLGGELFTRDGYVIEWSVQRDGNAQC